MNLVNRRLEPFPARPGTEHSAVRDGKGPVGECSAELCLIGTPNRHIYIGVWSRRATQE